MENFKIIKTKKEYMESRLALKDSMILFFALDEDDDNQYWFEYLNDFKCFEKVEIIIVNDIYFSFVTNKVMKSF